jgi:hypothetical protein
LLIPMAPCALLLVHGCTTDPLFIVPGMLTSMSNTTSSIGKRRTTGSNTKSLTPASSMVFLVIGNHRRLLFPYRLSSFLKIVGNSLTPPAILHHPSPVLISETFHDYLAQLPTWEHHLFANLILLHEPYDILQLINLRPLTLADALFNPITDNIHTDPQYSPHSPDLHWKLLMVSDGSDSASKMTFGWALTSGEPILQHVPHFSALMHRIRYVWTNYSHF